MFHGSGVLVPLLVDSIQGFVEEFMGFGRGMVEAVGDWQQVGSSETMRGSFKV